MPLRVAGILPAIRGRDALATKTQGRDALATLPTIIFPYERPFFDHNLHQLERGGVAGLVLVLLVQGFVDFPDGAGTSLPEHAENRQLAVCRTRGLLSSHGWSPCIHSVRSDVYIGRLRKNS